MKIKSLYKPQLTSFVFLAISSFVCSSSVAQISFEHGTWSEIKAKAKAEKKLIFVDAFTTWCGPCKWMAKNIFTNDTVAKYYNSTFVNAKIDIEAGEGKDLALLYSVRVYPSLLFIDGDGELVHRSAGSRDASAFIRLGNDALDPSKQFGSLDKKYKGGQRDSKFMKSYLAALEDVHLNTAEPLDEYLSAQKESTLTDPDNWYMLNTYLSDYNSKAFQMLSKYSDNFSKKYTPDTVNGKIYSIYVTECYRLIFSRGADSLKYLPFKEVVRQSGFVRKDELLLETDVAYYGKKKDYVAYSKTACQFIEKFKSNDGGVLNNCAYVFYEHVKDKAMLAKAELWAKKGYELDPNPTTTMDTYACLLFVNGKKGEAISLEKKAIALIKGRPENYNQNSATDMEDKIAAWSKD